MEYLKETKQFSGELGKAEKTVEIKETGNFALKEKSLFSKFGEKLVEWGKRAKEMPQKVSRATALILLLSLASGFAEANAAEIQGPPEGIKSSHKIERVDSSAGFSWKEFIKNIEISYGTENYTEENFKGESFEVSDPLDGDFYIKNMSPEDWNESQNLFHDSVKIPASSKAFFETVSKDSAGMSDAGKLFFLQILGDKLHQTYNKEMLEKGEFTIVSDEKMFQGLKDYFYGQGDGKTGICGNIHTFMAKTATEMGIEAWLQDGIVGEGSQKKDGHIIMSALVETKTGKQIIFLDYGTLIATGTLNYQRALGVLEMHNQNATVFYSFVGNPGKTPFYVKSLATEKMEEASGLIDTEQKLGSLTGGDELPDNGLKVEIGKETRKIKISNDMLALSYYDYKNSGNPYNSLESLQASRGALHFKKWGAKIDLSAAVLHASLKNFDVETTSQDDIVSQLAVSYANGIKLNKGELERLKLNFGATFNSASFYVIKTNQTLAENREGGLGVRMVYFNPNLPGKFWAGVEDSFRVATNDPENQDSIIQKTAENFRLGAEVRVKEGVIVNLEALGGKTEWGKKGKISAGIKSDKFTAKAEVEKKESDYERFIPSTLNIQGEIGYQTPIGEINVFGFVKNEKYKDADTEKVWNVGVKYRIILWN